MGHCYTDCIIVFLIWKDKAMDNLLQIIILVVQIIHIVFGVFGISIYRMAKGGGLFGNIGLCWGLMFFWGIIWCVILPAIFLPLGKEIFLMFPDAQGVPVILFIGWIPSFVVCTSAYTVIFLYKKGMSFYKKRNKDETPDKSLDLQKQEI